MSDRDRRPHHGTALARDSCARDLGSPPSPQSRSPAARAMAADRHRIVRLEDGAFVDVTRRQFDEHAEHPTYYASETALAKDWREIDRGPPDGRVEDEDWRRLP